MSADNVVFSYSGRIGSNASAIQFDTHVASGANIKDLNGNQINSVSKGTVSASTTVTGNYVGGTSGAGTNATVSYVGWMQTSGAAAAETITLAGSAPSQTITLSASSTGTCMIAAM